MVTSGALYRKRFSGIAETRSMTGGFDNIVYNSIKREENKAIRSLKESAKRGDKESSTLLAKEIIKA